MREIKFRAWDKEKGKMFYPDCKGIEINFDGVCEGKNWYIRDTRWKADCGVTSHLTGILMQFTGLKDKNGKDIYEGDIAKFGSRLGFISEVKWLPKNSGFLIKDKWGEWQWLYDVVASTSFEIIGNIHENPNLLK